MPVVHIGFNLQAGLIIDDEYAAYGVTISADQRNSTIDKAMIFDTDNPTGGDSDLSYDGLGGVLIISEDGDTSDPDDAAHGGELVLDFDDPVDLSRITLLDAEAGGRFVAFDADGTQIGSQNVGTGSDNDRRAVDLSHLTGVAQLVVEMRGSGALDNFEFITPDEPEPEPEPEPQPDPDPCAPCKSAFAADGAQVEEGPDVVWGTDDADFLQGTFRDETFAGNGGADRIRSYDGNDTIDGGGGDDNIDGGRGDDLIDAGEGDNLVRGGEGNDIVRVGTGADAVYTGGGDDVVVALGGDNFVKDHQGNNLICLADGDDRVRLGSGNDTVEATGGNNVVIDYGGDNVITTGDAHDYIQTSWGNDIIDAGDGDNYVDARANDDTITVGSGDDYVRAAHGNDRVTLGTGRDEADLGVGHDTVVITFEDRGPMDTISGGSGHDYLEFEMTESEAAAHESELAELEALIAAGSGGTIEELGLTFDGIEALHVAIVPDAA